MRKHIRVSLLCLHVEAQIHTKTHTPADIKPEKTLELKKNKKNQEKTRKQRLYFLKEIIKKHFLLFFGFVF
jgi:hypothetical protein